MTKAELIHGRGTPMSAHELTVEWPIYNRMSAELERRQEQLAGTESPETFDQEVASREGGG